MEKMMIFLLTALCLIGHTTVTWAAENDSAVIADSASVYKTRAEFSDLYQKVQTAKDMSHLQIIEAYLTFRDEYKNIIGTPGSACILAADEYLKIDEHEKALECYQWVHERYKNFINDPAFRKYAANLPYNRAVFGIAQYHYLKGDFDKANPYYQDLIDRGVTTSVTVKLKNDVHEQYFIPYFKPISEETLCNHCQINPINDPHLYPTSDPFKVVRMGGGKTVAEFMLKLMNDELEGGQK